MPVTAPTPIDNLPTPPDPNDRGTFNSRAYPWSLAQQTMATQANTLASNVYGNALDAAQSATDASAAKALAQQAADDAAQSLAWAGHFKGAWSALTGPLAQPASVKHLDRFWLLTQDLPDVAQDEPGASLAWADTTPAAAVVDASVITYTTGRVTKIAEDGVDTTITWNPDGTMNTVSYPRGSKTRTETFSYTNGVFTGMTASEV